MKQGGEHSSGFTIVETMIVLSVSATLAVSALAFINGRQNATQFQTGINNLQQQIQQVINETVSGYSPSKQGFKQDFRCTADNSGHQPRILNKNNGDQGTNDQCIMVGKALVFHPNFGIGDAGFLVYSLAGRRTDANGNDVRNQSEAKAVAVAPLTLNPIPPLYSRDTVTETKRYENGITYKWASYSNSGTYITADSDPPKQTLFAIASSFADYSDVGLKSQGQSYQLNGVNGVNSATDWNQTNSLAIAQTIFASGGLATDNGQDGPYQQVKLCFVSGTTAQSGLITIGDPLAGGLGVSLQVFSDTRCGRP